MNRSLETLLGSVVAEVSGESSYGEEGDDPCALTTPRRGLVRPVAKREVVTDVADRLA